LLFFFTNAKFFFWSWCKSSLFKVPQPSCNHADHVKTPSFGDRATSQARQHTSRERIRAYFACLYTNTPLHRLPDYTKLPQLFFFVYTGFDEMGEIFLFAISRQ
jgi:hypothetical protein